ncbi:hypothetical protein LZ30DRAFT_695740 [Colletotrichum cereale]|nr:hypothetical protein LZ30DRAFT_695740 [Colletotrichum cereale]
MVGGTDGTGSQISLDRRCWFAFLPTHPWQEGDGFQRQQQQEGWPCIHTQHVRVGALGVGGVGSVLFSCDFKRFRVMYEGGRQWPAKDAGKILDGTGQGLGPSARVSASCLIVRRQACCEAAGPVLYPVSMAGAGRWVAGSFAQTRTEGYPSW